MANDAISEAIGDLGAETSGPGKSYPMLCNNASGSEIVFQGQISAGFLSGKLPNRPSGRPKAGRRADFEAFPIRIRPECVPEARFAARKRHCST